MLGISWVVTRIFVSLQTNILTFKKKNDEQGWRFIEEMDGDEFGAPDSDWTSDWCRIGTGGSRMDGDLDSRTSVCERTESDCPSVGGRSGGCQHRQGWWRIGAEVPYRHLALYAQHVYRSHVCGDRQFPVSRYAPAEGCGRGCCPWGFDGCVYQSAH